MGPAAGPSVFLHMASPRGELRLCRSTEVAEFYTVTEFKEDAAAHPSGKFHKVSE